LIANDSLSPTHLQYIHHNPFLNITTMNKLNSISLAVSCLTLLSACSTSPTIIDAQQRMQSQTSPAVSAVGSAPIPVTAATLGTAAAAENRIAAMRPVLRSAAQPWIGGSKVVHVQDDTILPPIFNNNFKFSFDDSAYGGRVSLAVLAERLSRVSGVPVRLKNDVQSAINPLPVSAPRTSAALPAPFPQAGQPLGAQNSNAQQANTPSTSGSATFAESVTSIDSVEAKWDGSLRGYLDHVTSRLGLSWAYRDGQVVIERFVTESFEIAALAGTQSYNLSLSGSNSGNSGGNGNSGSSSSSLDVSEAGKTAALDSMLKSIQSMVTPAGGSVILNEGTGRFFVTAPKDVMSRVRELIKGEDQALQRQAQIQFDVYSVVSNENDQRGLDWNLLVSNMAKTMGVAIKTPASLVGADASSVSLSILESSTGSSARFAGSSAVLQLLNEVGSSALHRPISIVAMNHQWGRKTNIKTDGYVSETTPSNSSSAGSGSPGLKTSTITTGDKVIVKPAIMNNGDIVLKFGLSFSELLNFFDVTAGSGTSLQRVQTPVTSGTDDHGTVLLKPGQAMVITGLSRRLSSSDTRTLAPGMSPFVGGSLKDRYKVENFVVVVRAIKL
jgi:type IVB pilus formation R64 PilN family outer membrane protein